jgi:DNA-directed RNA polymerase specialized sigma24 family protein
MLPTATDSVRGSATAVPLDDLEGYAAALCRLPPLDRDAVIARIQMQSSYEDIARALGQRDPGTARQLVVSALWKLYEEMGT